MQALLKRLIDITGAGLLLIVSSPVLVAAIIMVRVAMGRPVFFLQQRAGRGGEIFTVYKLRTMAHERDVNGKLLPLKERTSRIGLLLRKSSIDELPQLWNVIKGDMSLIGPRPLVARYLPRYNSFQMRRHDVRPGITGWAQVTGRTALTWEERFAKDVWYVDHWSFWLDIKIVFKTIRNVLSAVDTTGPGCPTDCEFLGSGTHANDHKIPV